MRPKGVGSSSPNGCAHTKLVGRETCPLPILELGKIKRIISRKLRRKKKDIARQNITKKYKWGRKRCSGSKPIYSSTPFIMLGEKHKKAQLQTLHDTRERTKSTRDKISSTKIPLKHSETSTNLGSNQLYNSDINSIISR